MPTKNQGRMAQDMKRELIGIISQMKDPRLSGGLLTVTRLDVTPDLDVAKVHVSVMNAPEGAKSVVDALNKASGHVRTEISRINYRSFAYVTASKAENLFWLGRYTERVFTTLNVFFPFYDRVMDTDVDAFRPFARALDLPEDFANFDAFVNTFLYDKWNRDSVRSAISSAFYNAVVLRPELGSSTPAL